MWVPSVNMMELICSLRMFWFLLLRGLPSPQSDPVASHLEVSSWSPVYWLNRCNFLNCSFRSCMDPAVMLTSSAYPWSS